MKEKFLSGCKLTFPARSILTKEMLNEMYNSGKTYMDVLYADYEDGILTGLGVYKRQEEVFIKAGLLKYKGIIYRLLQDYNLSEFVRNSACKQVEYSLYFMPRNLEEEETEVPKRKSVENYELELKLHTEQEEQSERLEGFKYAIFKLMTNGNINIQRKSEAIKEDVICSYWKMSCCRVSGKTGRTFHSWLFAQVRELLENKKNPTNLDYVLLNELYCHEVLERAMLLKYLKDCGIDSLSRVDYSKQSDKVLLENFLKAIKESQPKFVNVGPSESPKQAAPSSYRGGGLLV